MSEQNPRDVFAVVGVTVEGKYRIDEVVGEGGFGVVYRGWHAAFDHPVAIKFLKVPAHFPRDAHQAFVERFLSEGRTLAKLGEEPAVVRVLDLGVTEVRGSALPYLVLEWLEGHSLATELARRSKPFSLAEALSIVRPVLAALAIAHEHQVAHRDVKPENVFLAAGKRGRSVKLLDFGIAKAMQEGETVAQRTTRTTSGFSAFTPRYGAPEQFRTKVYGPTGPWTDVHAVGLLLTELLTSRPAYDGDDTGDFYEAALAASRPTPGSRGANVAEPIEELCALCTARQPAERFSNAGALLNALEEVAQQLGEIAGKPGDVYAVEARPSSVSLTRTEFMPPPASFRAEESTTGAPVIEPVPRRSVARRRSQASMFVGAGLAAALALLLFTVVHQATSTSRTTTADAGAPPAASIGALQGSAALQTTGFGQKVEPLEVGTRVVVRRRRLDLRLGVAQATRGDRVLVSDQEWSTTQITPATCPSDYAWREGNVIVFTKPASTEVGAGIVEHVRLDNQLTVRAWDGRATTSLTFSPPQSMRPGQLPLTNAWPVRADWVEELRALLAKPEAAVALDKRDACAENPSCKADLKRTRRFDDLIAILAADKDVDGLVALGDEQLKASQARIAIAAYDAARSLRGDDPRILDALGTAYLEANMKPKAREVLTQAASLGIDDKKHQKRVGQLLDVAGDAAGSKAALKRSCTLGETEACAEAR